MRTVLYRPRGIIRCEYPACIPADKKAVNKYIHSTNEVALLVKELEDHFGKPICTEDELWMININSSKHA